VENRGAIYHRGRLGEAMREEIETLVEGELADPRIGLVTVTGVDLAEHGKSATVRVSVGGDEDEVRRSMEGLEAARAYVRHEVASRLRLRRAPELWFRLDSGPELQARVDELLARRKKREKPDAAGSDKSH